MFAVPEGTGEGVYSARMPCPRGFLIGRDGLRYEVVVNSIEKDRIRGYVSAPKDKVLSAEGPKLVLQ